MYALIFVVLLVGTAPQTVSISFMPAKWICERVADSLVELTLMVDGERARLTDVRCEKVD